MDKMKSIQYVCFVIGVGNLILFFIWLSNNSGGGILNLIQGILFLISGILLIISGYYVINDVTYARKKAKILLILSILSGLIICFLQLFSDSSLLLNFFILGALPQIIIAIALDRFDKPLPSTNGPEKIKIAKPELVQRGYSAHNQDDGSLPEKNISLLEMAKKQTVLPLNQPHPVISNSEKQVLASREIEDRSLLIQQPQVIRAYEFYAGYIRVKISVKNPTPFTIHDVILEPDVDRAIIYLERHEPEEYPSENERIILGNINPGNDRTVSFYLEPIICAKEGTDVNCHIRYKDAQGQPGSIDMEPLKIQVVCPIFETKEPVNIGELKQLIDSLPSKDTKIFSVPRNLDAPTQLKIFQSVIQLHDIRHISTLRRDKNFESWYYGKTKVSQKDMVLKLGIVKDMDMVEITAFSYDPKDLTGFLAEINRHVNEEVSKRGNVQKIFNVSIKDSVVQRTNLMSFCDDEGKCSGDVTIEDSVVMRSNIG